MNKAVCILATVCVLCSSCTTMYKRYKQRQRDRETMRGILAHGIDTGSPATQFVDPNERQQYQQMIRQYQIYKLRYKHYYQDPRTRYRPSHNGRIYRDEQWDWTGPRRVRPRRYSAPRYITAREWLNGRRPSQHHLGKGLYGNANRRPAWAD